MWFNCHVELNSYHASTQLCATKKNNMKIQLIIAAKLLLVMTIITGIAYPFLMTGTAQLLFPGKANGSLVMKDGVIVGSSLIGQQFDSTIYFWSRPSATNYSTFPSGASNLGPTSEKLMKQVAGRRDIFLKSNRMTDISQIPKEMIFASASGLDPHISPKAAYLQLERVADSRKMNAKQRQELLQLIERKTENTRFSLLGEPRINVFELNLALDNIK
jgi:K+-transporting ATPase ATPase C chain